MNGLLAELSASGFRWCIAGGFAAFPALATDCDVWVFATDDVPLDEYRSVLLEVVSRALPGFVEEGEGEDPTTYGNLGLTVQKVGRYGSCHLMVTDAAVGYDYETGVLRLLDGFDVSTHQCAITDEGTFVKGHQWTPLTVPPVALRDTESTVTRMCKIADRYVAFRADEANGGDRVPDDDIPF